MPSLGFAAIAVLAAAGIAVASTASAQIAVADPWVRGTVTG